MRKSALKILNKLTDGAYLNLAFKEVLLSSHLSSLDTAFVKELVFGVVRNKILLDYIIRQNSKIRLKKIVPSVLNILRMGVYQIFFMDKIPDHASVSEAVELAKKEGGAKTASFVNAVLRSIIRNNPKKEPDLSSIKDKKEYLSIKYSYPEALADFFCSTFSNRAEALMMAGNQAPKLSVRINTLKITKEEFKRRLDELQIVYEDTPYTDCGLYLFGATEEARAHLFGLFVVQDQSSQIASLALSPKEGELVLDLCSSPGGKTTHLAELMNNKGKILATDLYESRIKSVKFLAESLGIDIIDAYAHDATEKDENLIGKADRILADVPCSGLGIIRRKPDIKYKEDITNFDELGITQIKILDTAYEYLKPGGTLVYSTCTINPGENKELVKKFLSRHSDMKVDKIKSTHLLGKARQMAEDGFIEIFPDTDESDGFFVCRMTKEKQ